MKNREIKTFIFVLLLIIVCACSNTVNDEDLEHPFNEDAECFVPDENTKTLKVGKGKEFKSISEAAAVATDNCIIEVDAGTYSGDVARWRQNDLIIRAVGGEVILDAAGKNFDGKGIWEVDGGKICIEGFIFKNAKVPDGNGAGIRLTKGFVTVRNCKFLNNENGIMTSNDGVSTLKVLNSEFAYNRSGDGLSHNIYVGEIASFEVSGSWFHHEVEGHLIKTRAKISVIKYNLIADGNDAQSTASYEIDFASGGIGIVVGNIIQQSRNSRNSIIISYSQESRRPWTDNELYVSHNIIINDRTSTDLIISSPVSPAMYQGAFNNLLSENTQFNMNFMDVEANNLWFKAGGLNADYTPTKQLYDSWMNTIDKDVDRHLSPKLKAMGISLVPTAEYQHPLKIRPLTP